MKPIPRGPRFAVVVFVAFLVRTATAFSDANWMSLGSGVNGQVSALAASGNKLYAGGIGGYVAQWDGTNWSVLGLMAGEPSYNTPGVSALAISGNTLYAGGSFTTVGGILASNIAQWNGSSWSALGLGIGGVNYPSVGALVVSGGKLYAGGYFTTAGGTTANYVAQWDGTNWSALGSGWGMNPGVNALAVSGGNLYAAGSGCSAICPVQGGYVSQWDGTNWLLLGSGMGGGNSWYLPSVNTLTVFGGTLYAGGNFTTAGGTPANYIAQWNGSSWLPLASGLSGAVVPPSPPFPGARILEVDVLGISRGTLYAGGYFTDAGGSPANFIAQWDGTNWSNMGSGMNYGVFALAATGGMLYAGGNFTTAGTNASAYVAGAVLNPVPILSQPQMANHHFKFTVNGPAGSNAVIYAKTNLANAQWVPLATNGLGIGSMSFTDPLATNYPSRVYRAELKP